MLVYGFLGKWDQGLRLNKIDRGDRNTEICADHPLNCASEEILDVQWLYIPSGVRIPVAFFPFGHEVQRASLLGKGELLKNAR